MLRWVFFAVGLIVLTAAATLAPQLIPEPRAAVKVPAVVPKGPQPRLKIDQEPIFDFGTMAQKDTAAHSWRINNEGEADLDIWLDGKPTCSCTIAKLEHNQKATVKPGESTTIELEWNTKTFHDDYSQGANFGTNDPRTPRFNLAIKGIVHPAITVYPPEMMQFPNISNEEPHQAMIAVYSKHRPETKVLKATTSKPDLITAHARPMTEEERKQLNVAMGYDVIVEIKPGMPLGNFFEQMVIETDHPKEPEVKVSIGGKVVGPISVVPPSLRMRGISGQEGASRDLTLLVRGGKEVHFEVVSRPEGTDVEVTPDDRPGMKGRYRLRLTVPAGTPAGTINGGRNAIVLKTDHPMVHEVRIPVDILVSRVGPG